MATMGVKWPQCADSHSIKKPCDYKIMIFYSLPENKMRRKYIS